MWGKELELYSVEYHGSQIAFVPVWLSKRGVGSASRNVGLRYVICTNARLSILAALMSIRLIIGYHDYVPSAVRTVHV